MHFALVLVLPLITSPVATHALSLLDTLRQHASKFAQIIESDAKLLELYQSGSVQTVYAPVDMSIAKLRRRDTDDQTQAQRQSQNQVTSLQALRTKPALVAETNDKSGNLNGKGQAVVAHGTDVNSNNTKRALFPRQYTNITAGAVRISSGLGNNVSIIQGDIPYDGGVIHTVDGFFTKPVTLSATSNQTGNTKFASRLGISNLTALLDNTPSITCFLPSNAAFAAAAGNSSQTPAQIASQLSGHIVIDQVLYLPLLVDGATFKTKAGTTITVSVRSGRFFINGALIVQSDLILENGVAHILDKVIPDAATPAPPITGSGSSTATFINIILTILGIATAFLM